MVKAMSYGAVLWDIAGEERHLGGCTLNLISHLGKLGTKSYMYTKLGADELGSEALKGIADLGVDGRFIQVDKERTTGFAKITFNGEKVPTYHFVENASDEFIEADEPMIEALKQEQIDLFCYGTYCQSGEMTRRNLQKILKACHFPLVFCDINLRVENPEREMLEGSLKYADILKLNEEEVDVLGKVLYSGIIPEAECVKRLQSDYRIKIICVTKGKQGCSVYDEHSVGIDIPAHRLEAVDTVGAGDAFGAGFIFSYLQGLPLRQCGENGNLLGGYVATRRGAIPEYSEAIKAHFKIAGGK